MFNRKPSTQLELVFSTRTTAMLHKICRAHKINRSDQYLRLQDDDIGHDQEVCKSITYKKNIVSSCSHLNKGHADFMLFT